MSTAPWIAALPVATLPGTDVYALLRPSPTWPEFESCMFELFVVEAQQALEAHTVLDRGQSTLRVYAATRTPADLKDPALFAELTLAPVPCLAIRRAVARHWEVPAGGTRRDVIVLDGNNRLLALAMRHREGLPIPTSVAIFVTG